MHLSMHTAMRNALCLIAFAFLASCSSNPPAPVIDRLPTSKPSTASTTIIKKPNRPTYKAGDWRPDTYIVKKGDTLFSIGLEHGYYYKDIAMANNISAPYNINVGQTLKFSTLKDKTATTETKPVPMTNSDGVEIIPINTDVSSSGTATTSPVTKAPIIVALTEPKAIREPYSEEALKKPLPVAKAIEKTTDKSIQTTAASKPVVVSTTDTKPDVKPNAVENEDIDWAWPTKGKVVANFNEASNKGLDIAGSSGQAITAAATGKVIYSGSDLRGYGKLVIIKHNSNYLSVYAHNSLILAKEGQLVIRGQKIAEMGNTDSNTVKLHFEIRRQGKSVDPAKYLTSN